MALTTQEVLQAGAGTVRLTYADLVTLAAGNLIIPGVSYLITDRADTGILVEGMSTNQVALAANGGFLNADWQNVGDYSGVIAITGIAPTSNIGVWQKTQGTIPYNPSIVVYFNQLSAVPFASVNDVVTGGGGAAGIATSLGSNVIIVVADTSGMNGGDSVNIRDSGSATIQTGTIISVIDGTHIKVGGLSGSYFDAGVTAFDVEDTTAVVTSALTSSIQYDITIQATGSSWQFETGFTDVPTGATANILSIVANPAINPLDSITDVTTGATARIIAISTDMYSAGVFTVDNVYGVFSNNDTLTSGGTTVLEVADITLTYNPQIGDIVIWQNSSTHEIEHYQRTLYSSVDSTNPQVSGDYTVLGKTLAPTPLTLGYMEVWDQLEYVFEDDWIQFRRDKVYEVDYRYTKDADTNGGFGTLGYSAILLFPWGRGQWRSQDIVDAILDQSNSAGEISNNSIQFGAVIQGNEIDATSTMTNNTYDFFVVCKNNVIVNSSAIGLGNGNTFGGGMSIQNNQLANSSIIDNIDTLNLSAMDGNVIFDASNITNCEMFGINSIVSNNTLKLGSVISNNQLISGATLSGNSLTSGSSINNNSLGVNDQISANILAAGAAITATSGLGNGQINNNTLGVSASISNNQMSTSSIIVQNTLGPNCHIDGNVLAVNSVIGLNTFFGGNQINKNVLLIGSAIINNIFTDAGGTINGNTVNSEGFIRDNTLALNCFITGNQMIGGKISGSFTKISANTMLAATSIDSNIMYSGAFIAGNAFGAGDIVQGNLMLQNACIQNNTSNGSLYISFIEMGVHSAIQNSTFVASGIIGNSTLGSNTTIDSSSLDTSAGVIFCNIANAVTLTGIKSLTLTDLGNGVTLDQQNTYTMEKYTIDDGYSVTQAVNITGYPSFADSAGAIAGNMTAGMRYLNTSVAGSTILAIV